MKKKRGGKGKGLVWLVDCVLQECHSRSVRWRCADDSLVKEKIKVELKYKSPLVKQCTISSMTGCTGGVDTPTMQSYKSISWFTSDKCYSPLPLSQMNGDHCKHRDANTV